MADPQTRRDNNASDGIDVAPVELRELGRSHDAEKPRAPQEANMKMILDIPVDIRVELGHTVLTIGEILRLGQGSIIALDRLTGSPADLVVNGKRVGQGDVVVVDENFGIRITKLLKPEERLDAL
jgi:flagellar motor switch protein FliN/FliY